MRRIEPYHSAFLISGTAKGLALLNSLLVIRYAAPVIPENTFALFASLVGLSAFASLLDLGFGNNLVIAAAHYSAAPTPPSRTALHVLLINSVVASLAIGIIAALGVSAVLTVINLHYMSAKEAATHVIMTGVFLLAFACTPLSLTIQKFFQGMQYPWLANGPLLLAQLFLSIVIFTIDVGAISGPTILGLTLLPSPLLSVLAFVLWVHQSPLSLPSGFRASTTVALRSVRTGFRPYACQSVSAILFSSPPWLANTLMSPATAIEAFAIIRITAPIVVVVTLFTQPLWPEYARLLARNEFDAGWKLFARSLAYCIGFSLLVMCAVISNISYIENYLMLTISEFSIIMSAVWILLMAVRQCCTMFVLASRFSMYTTVTFVVAPLVIGLLAVVSSGIDDLPKLFLVLSSIEVVIIVMQMVDIGLTCSRYSKDWSTRC